MLDLVHVTAVRVVSRHRLALKFEDGTEGEIDFAGWPLRGLFVALADPAFFRQVQLDEELGTIAWPNGADIAPETLHHWVLEGSHPAAA